MELAGLPGRWIVTLRSGVVLEVAAAGYEEDAGYLLFEMVVETTPEELALVTVLWTFPGRRTRGGVLVAKIPAAEVVSVVAAESGPTAG